MDANVEGRGTIMTEMHDSRLMEATVSVSVISHGDAITFSSRQITHHWKTMMTYAGP